MIRLNARYRVLSVFLLAIVVGIIGMQERIVDAILTFIPPELKEIVAIIIILLILGLREVVKEYGQVASEQNSEDTEKVEGT